MEEDEVLDMGVKHGSSGKGGNGLDTVLLGAILGAVIALIGTVSGSAISYYQAKGQREYEYRKDLAEAIRTAYADFLKVAFSGGGQTEKGMEKYLTDLRTAYAPVSLLGSKDVKENISKVLSESQRILEGGGAEKKKIENINDLMQNNINDLYKFMGKDIFERHGYLSYERTQERQPNWSPGYKDPMYESARR
jgi:hypothetical protein